MNVIQTELPGVVIIEPRVFPDDRGFFLESYNRDRYRSAGIDVTFVQDNHSRSTRGVVRGMHYQIGRPQAKLVRVAQGEIFDVCIDIRRGSPTFGRWIGVRLSSQNHRQLYVPEGFAHGFLALSETVDMLYKCSDVYVPEAERGVRWDDPEIGIDWPLDNLEPVLSSKDRGFGTLHTRPEADLPVYRAQAAARL